MTPENHENTGDAIGYLQRVFGERFAETQKKKEALRREVLLRKALAYALKSIAGIGGLAISSGISSPAAKWIGIAIALAVFVDHLLANFSRLTGLVPAVHAYERLLRQVEAKHQLELATVLKLRNSNPAEAKIQLADLLNNLLSKLQGDSEKIEIALTELDIKILGSLNPETHTTSTQKKRK